MLLEIDHILQRADAIRWRRRDLAKAAGMPVSTVARFASRKTGNTETLVRLQQAVVAEERQMLARLLQLHGE